MFEVYGLIIPENADALFALGENIDELYMINELLDISELVWKKQKYYYLTFHASSGTGTMPDQTMPCGTAAALSANLFSRIGYLFQGWNPDADGGALYTDGQQVADIAGAGETLALYAIWKAITWYVKFHANGGSGSMQNQAHAYDRELALTANAFTRSEYTFLGWGTTASGAVAYGDKQAVKNLKSVHGAVLNLYAIWQHNGYYAIQNGSLVNCPNAIAEQQSGHSNRSGVITLQTTTVYGAYGHTKAGDNYNDYWGAYTGNLNTEGCTKLSFTFATFETTVSAEVRDYWVYGDGVEIEHETINSVTAYSEYIASRTVDVSNYSTVAVRVRIQDNNNSDAWMGAGFVNVRIHN